MDEYDKQNSLKRPSWLNLVLF